LAFYGAAPIASERLALCASEEVLPFAPFYYDPLETRLAGPARLQPNDASLRGGRVQLQLAKVCPSGTCGSGRHAGCAVGILETYAYLLGNRSIKPTPPYRTFPAYIIQTFSIVL
ncbi:MAG: hypothetical protein WAO78_03275, partial [Roseovarius sp.]